jgi:hypothetical protein
MRETWRRESIWPRKAFEREVGYSSVMSRIFSLRPTQCVFAHRRMLSRAQLSHFMTFHPGLCKSKNSESGFVSLH